MDNGTEHGAVSAPVEEQTVHEDTDIQEPAKVILFNDDVHTFEEVIGQLIKALRCSTAKAEALAWEAHANGRALVYSGTMPRCIEVSGILEEIRLMTQIEVS